MRAETRHTIVLVVGTGTAAALSMMYIVYTGRVLGPVESADFFAGISIIFLFSAVLAPIDATITRFISLYTARGEDGKVPILIREIMRRIVFYGSVGTVIGLLFLKPLADVLQFCSIWSLIVIYAIIYLTLLLQVPRGVLRGLQNFREYNINIVLEGIVRLTVGVILLWNTRNATSGLLAYFFALLVVVIISWLQLRHICHVHRPEQVDGRAIKHFTAPIFLLSLGRAGFQNIDILFVKYYFSAFEVGLYGATATLARSIGVIFTPFGVLLLPLLTSIREQGHNIMGPLITICTYFLLLSAGPIIIFWIWSEEVTISLYGSRFNGVAVILLPLAGSLLVGHLSSLVCQAFVSMNNFWFLFLYLFGIVIEIIGLYFWHQSLLMVVAVVFTVKTIILITIGISLGYTIHYYSKRTQLMS